jgi:hypothetical protein
MDGDLVDNEEDVYRRAVASSLWVQDGVMRAGERAFSDPDNEPSVDRAKLRVHPSQTRLDPSEAVVQLSVREIRAIRSVTLKLAGGVTKVFVIDVVSDPILNDSAGLPDNPAHAKIRPDEKLTSTPMKRLQSVLSFINTVVLEPEA